MITSNETTTQASTRKVYTTAAPDTSNITATVENGIATITYGGGTLGLPLEALPTLTALVATIGAGIDPIAPEGSAS